MGVCMRFTRPITGWSEVLLLVCMVIGSDNFKIEFQVCILKHDWSHWRSQLGIIEK